MKKRIINSTRIMAILIVTLFATNSCKNLFNDPLQDKETGEDLTLLLLDLNFFETKIMVHLQNDETREYITEDELFVNIYGENADKIVSLEGEMISEFSVSGGILEIAVDPNYTPSENNPIEFIISAETEEYKWFSIPLKVTISNTGIIDVVVELIYEGDDDENLFKSAYTTQMAVPFDTLITAVPPLYNYREFNKVKIKNGVKHYGQFRPDFKNTEFNSIAISASSLNSSFPNTTYGYNGNYEKSGSNVKTDFTSISTSGADTTFTTIKSFRFFTAVDESYTKCPGVNVIFTIPEGVTLSSSFNYTLTLSDGNVMQGILTPKENQGGFIASTINNIYYPKGENTATLVIFNNGQFKATDSSYSIQLCSDVNVVLEQMENTEEYSIITNISCADNLGLGLAPSLLLNFIPENESLYSTNCYLEGGYGTVALVPGDEDGNNYDVTGTYNNETRTYKMNTKNTIDYNVPEEYDASISVDVDNKIIYINVKFVTGNCPF